MDLFEHEAKELFAEYGIPIQRGRVADTATQAKTIAEEFAAAGSPLVVVKAQVKTGGRGKAGGVKLAKGPDEAYEHATRILGMDIKGHIVHKVLIAEASDIAEEYYLSFLLDRAEREGLTVRACATLVAKSRSHGTFVGTVEQLADYMQLWFETGGCDGFNIMPAYFPDELDLFVDHVVPELQRRGLFRRDYAGTMLRDHLGLPRPKIRR